MDKPAPDFSLETLDGEDVHLSELRGKVILLDFWATWCGPCTSELPHIQEIHEQYQSQGLVVLAICTDRDRNGVYPFVEKNEYTFQVLYADKNVQSDYGVRGIPSIYLIDRQGRVRFHHVGYGPGGEEGLMKEVERLLSEETDSAE